MSEPPRTADVVVVGGGVHGASVAYHLAHKRAGRVVLVEKRFLASGPTGRSTAVVRRTYAHDYLTVSANRSARYAEVADPDRYNEAADFEEIVKTTEAITHRFPVMERGHSRGGYAALYDETPDHQPVLGPVPAIAGLYLDCGWSGHGFKHSPVTGQVISEVILSGRYPDGLDASEFSVTRFCEGRKITPFATYSPPKYDT